MEESVATESMHLRHERPAIVLDEAYSGRLSARARVSDDLDALSEKLASTGARRMIQTPTRTTADPYRRASSIPLHRRSRLPWLDGSEGRKSSMPLVPGAYTEELPEAAEVTLEQHPWHNLHTPVELPPQPPPSRESMPSAATGRTPAPSSETQSSKPAIPLIALARELYRTDSSAAMSESETERSMRGSRRRALGGPARSKPSTHSRSISEDTPLVPSHILPLQDETLPRPSRHAELDTMSPRTPGTRRQTGLNSSDALSDRPSEMRATPRQPSITLQPIRSKRVTIRPEDLDPASRLNRRQSLSVQPLRSQGLSRSFQEDLSTDYVRRPRPRSIASQSPAEKGLRNSIAGLESLMQQAVLLAKEAADSGRSEEVPGIMDEARLALHRATTSQESSSSIQQTQVAPANQSSGSSTHSSSSDESQDSEMNQLSTHPAFRRSNFPSARDGPTSDQGSTMRASSPSGAGQTVWDEDYPNHRLDPHARAEEPKPLDFAYNPPIKLAPGAPSLEKGKAKEGLQNQQRPPAPTRPSYRSDASGKAGPSSNQPLPSASGEPSIPPRNSSLANQRSQGTFEGPTSPNFGATATGNDSASVDPGAPIPGLSQRPTGNWGRDKYDEKDFGKKLDLRGKHHLTLKDGERFSIHHGHKRQPIARNWSIARKRFVATVTCLNTALIGVLIGIYAGEVPAIQYTLADLNHRVILGNVVLYIGMAITTFLFWPLPLLHGRKPYTLVALGIALPLQIPQAIIVQERRRSVQNYSGYLTGLLVTRGVLGLALGFAHINFKSTLLDLFGSSLQSDFPHGETVITDDIRRHGGGMGYWLGLWSFSFLGSLSLGFLIGADVISGLNQAWGFYICVILIALALFINVLTPETRRSPHRRTMQEVELPNDSISRRVARGEIKMHVSGDGPKWWWEEVLSGVYLSLRMLTQSGFLLMALYMGWIYAQIVLIIVLLGNLLSTEYQWRPEYVGLGVLSIGIGTLLAIPNSKANFFSRSRINPPRTDSMTFQPRFAWTSHLIRRAVFMIALPAAGLAYTLSSKGHQVQYMVPIVFAGMIGYISNLAIAECNGIIMEAFDTSDLQPGTNSRHRLQSLQANIKQRRTTYTSYPRVSAGLFAAQSIGFLFAAAATGVGGAVTRRVGAQKATAITAGVLFGLTLLLTCSLSRFRTVQVIPNELFGAFFGSADAEDRRKSAASMESDKSWRAVVIGNPSGKNRRMNWLELGSLSRWTEIRRLNRLLNRSTTQGLNTGWQ